MNPYIAEAVAAMDKVPVSRYEHPGSWAMDPASCRFLAGFVRALGAKKIIEFGSGFSTLMMAREIAPLENNYLLSIDSSPLYSAMAKEAFDGSGCQAKVEFRVAPLRPRFYGPRLLLSYSLPAGLLEALGPFDLALIDAPHLDYGRESVFYDVFRALAPGGYVVLDDANREDMERAYVRSWQAAYEGAIDPILLEGIGNGLGVIEKLSEAGPAYPGKGALTASLKTLNNFGRLLFLPEEQPENTGD
ncbi:MAG: class I SAM-dependent methyltransferase [Elusimicrobia bacterium]|nr:class I SAM-dependent methyltransferase [Elusimicrobiota bacterium]